MAIRLYWSGGNRNEINFGDAISPLVVQLLSGKEVTYGSIYTCDLAAIGSLLNKIIPRQWKRVLHLRFDKIRIWGTGSFSADIAAGHDVFSFAAVRGPLTRDALGLDAASTPLGDPGLLVDRFDIKTEKKFRWGIIPHLVDRDNPAIRALLNSSTTTCMIDLADPDLLGTLKKIRSCDFIISSSLHGLITADALGIPNVWMRVSGDVYGGDWKFSDYFASVGRTETAPLLPAQQPLMLLALEDTATRVEKNLVAQRQTDLEKAFIGMGL